MNISNKHSTYLGLVDDIFKTIFLTITVIFVTTFFVAAVTRLRLFVTMTVTPSGMVTTALKVVSVCKTMAFLVTSGYPLFDYYTVHISLVMFAQNHAHNPKQQQRFNEQCVCCAHVSRIWAKHLRLKMREQTFICVMGDTR